MARKALKKVYGVFKSVQLAVAVIISIAASLAVGTFMESAYDTKTARFYVYDSAWFTFILTLLGLNIFVVAMSRYPWKKHHTPFLMAHAGILMLLTGSWITTRAGVDGSMSVTEGETRNAVEFDSSVLYLADGDKVSRVDIPWLPPERKFRPLKIPGLPITIDQYLTHAEPSVTFKAADKRSGETLAPAVKVLLKGGPMQLRQEMWLWGGDLSWSVVAMGPARFALVTDPALVPPAQKNQASLELLPQKDGSLRWKSVSIRGEKAAGRAAAGKVTGHVIDPGWKGLTITVLDWVPSAMNDTRYVSSRMQYGDQAPPSAVHVSVEGTPGGIWLGQGDRASLDVPGRQVMLSYAARRIILPFSIHLERFNIEHYEGTANPSSYASTVRTVQEAGPSEPIVVSMNEPLKMGGFTFYQASYVPGEPRPVTSIFSVNRDPGRWLKYGGSLLLVGGSIVLFGYRNRQRRKEVKSS